jgi:hypothetical protein
MSVTGFGYLLAIISPKTCDSTITRKHRNTLLPIKVTLIPMAIKTWETFQLPLLLLCFLVIVEPHASGVMMANK